MGVELRNGQGQGISAALDSISWSSWGQGLSRGWS